MFLVMIIIKRENADFPFQPIDRRVMCAAVLAIGHHFVLALIIPVL